jgi:nitrogen fixation protein NifX
MSVLRRLKVVRSTEQECDMEIAIKLAFATTDSKYVNQHFGSAKGFAIYEVTPDSVEQLEATQFGVLAQDGNEDKLDEKLEILSGCTAVYCQAAGPSAVKRLMSIGVQPVKVSEGCEIEKLIADVQKEMRDGATGWLAKAIAKQTPQSSERFDSMEADGWEE